MAETNATLTEKHAAYLGLDVGKFFHWAYAVDREGTVLLSRRVANSEAELDAAIAELPADTLVVVDQRRNIGALAIRRARAAGRPVAYLPGS
ncbi:MAG: transposase, partial [Eggerthellaceae bacterium]|nr:transposase [Eggerthellaceae bacterium]